MASVTGASKRAENAHRAAAWLAWSTAALGRMDKMPSLESLLGPVPSKKPQKQTWQQMMAGAEAWVAATQIA